MMKYPQARLIIMSKAPIPGKVKTRLIPLLGAVGATECHRMLLEQTLAGLCGAALCPVELSCSPDVQHEFFIRARRRYPLQLTAQVPGDLGQRMSHAVAHALREADRVVVVGADCPAMTPADIDTALRQLGEGADVVLGPARDGGYYLIGLRRHHPALFAGIEWGGADVLETTRARLAGLDLTEHLLATRYDIDTPSDYQAWQAGNMTGILGPAPG